MTNADLQRRFKSINRKYFRGRVKGVAKFKKFSRLEHWYLGYTLCELKEMYVNAEIKNWERSVEATLIHEMVHLALPVKVQHGPRFEKEMLRLAKAGAFKGVW